MKHRDIRRIDIDDARPYANVYRLDDDSNELLILENWNHVPLQGKALQTGFVLLAMCKSGSISFILNGQKHRLEEGGALVTFGQSVLEEVEMSDDFDAVAIIQSHDFFQESLMSMIHLWPFLLFLMENPVLQLGEEERQNIHANYELLVNRFRQDNNPFLREATICNLQAAYLDLCSSLSKLHVENVNVPSRSYGIFDRFIRLLSREYMEHRDVQWYAAEINLTPKYLSEVVKTVSGRTASQWISLLVVTEMKSLLRNTNLSIKEITQKMNFPNQSFFGKYFKNITGISPLDFRNYKK